MLETESSEQNRLENFEPSYLKYSGKLLKNTSLFDIL